MTKPVVTATTLVTEDGVPIDAIHLPVPERPRDRGRARFHAVVAAAQRLAHRQPASTGWPAYSPSTSAATGAPAACPRWATVRSATSTWWSRWARELGYQRVAAVGFSMGASIVLRHAGLVGGLDAVVSVSGPGRWYYRGTEPMRRVHFAVEHRLGRFVTRRWLKTRISPEGWKLIPVPPAEAAAQISPVPLLIVHGEKDHYFPPEHARQLYMAAREPKDLWLMPGMGHAEAACGQELVDRIGRWIGEATSPARPGDRREAAGVTSPGDAAAPTPNAAA